MAKIIKTYVAQKTMEGAGVEVNRVFGYYQVPDFDPFLMLDYFESDSSDDSPGFPWHPHKGIETITYMLRGNIKHEDSLGHVGTIGAGDLQWMSAGGGIYHQEMPQPSDSGYQGFQFWLNMPKKNKLDKPKYQELEAKSIITIKKDNVEVLLISGDYEDFSGPIDKTNLGVRMMHVKIKPNKTFSLRRDDKKNGFIFIFSGSGFLGDDEVVERSAYLIGDGDITISAKDEKLEFIFAEGIAIDEPIAWHGPMVMNTNREIEQALKDLRDGTFA